MEGYVLPKCQKCQTGDLVPLSDFGSQGAPIHYKAWVCTNVGCGFNIKIRNGDVYVNEPINNGAAYPARSRQTTLAGKIGNLLIGTSVGKVQAIPVGSDSLYWTDDITNRRAEVIGLSGSCGGMTGSWCKSKGAVGEKYR